MRAVVIILTIFALSACNSDSQRIQELEAENAMLKERLDSVGREAIKLVDQAEQARIRAENALEKARDSVEAAIMEREEAMKEARE